eukprot:scaffold35211_cov68-Phaeocystis_antarctica.AAC.2
MQHWPVRASSPPQTSSPPLSPGRRGGATAQSALGWYRPSVGVPETLDGRPSGVLAHYFEFIYTHQPNSDARRRPHQHDAEPRERAAAPVAVAVRTATAAYYTTAASAAAGTWRPRRAAATAHVACCAASARRVATVLVGRTLRGGAAGRVPLAGRLTEQSRRLDRPAEEWRAEDRGGCDRRPEDRDDLL